MELGKRGSTVGLMGVIDYQRCLFLFIVFLAWT
jgi:hypothetical protein